MDGILIVDKPKGASSHDIVDFIRRKFSLKKVGHAGTLDPQVTGVLVILIGNYTKRSRYLSGQDKEYEACLSLGVATDSLDSQGRIIKRRRLGALSWEKVERVFSQFLGRVEQTPPMFSALKYKGKRLYTLARMGKQIPRPARQIHIYKLKIEDFKPPHIYFTVRCSKGTYIRSLCADIAEKLGCPGHMSQLRRTCCGTFAVNQAIAMDRLKGFSPQQLRQALLTIGC